MARLSAKPAGLKPRPAAKNSTLSASTLADLKDGGKLLNEAKGKCEVGATRCRLEDRVHPNAGASPTTQDRSIRA